MRNVMEMADAGDVDRRRWVERRFGWAGLAALGAWFAGDCLWAWQRTEEAPRGVQVPEQITDALKRGETDEARVALVKNLAANLQREEKDADLHVMMMSIRQSVDDKLAVGLFRAFLSDEGLAIPAACALPGSADPFFHAVEAGREGYVTDCLGMAFRAANKPALRQVFALAKAPDWLCEGFIKRLMAGKMLGVGRPRDGGRLAARLLLLLNEREHPGSRTIQADFVERQMEDPASRGDVRAMAAYLAGVTETCPAFVTTDGWKTAVVSPMGEAWRKRLRKIAAKQGNGAAADWRKTIDDCFIPPLQGMEPDERALAATGLDGCAYLLLEPTRPGPDRIADSIEFSNMPATPAARFKALKDLFRAYPEFLVSIERMEFAAVPPDAAGRPDEPPLTMVAALADSSIPPARRFVIVDELCQTPKERYQEVAAEGFVLAMRDALKAGGGLSDSLISNEMNKFHWRGPHVAWTRAAADTAAMTAAAFKSPPMGGSWRDHAILEAIMGCAIIGRDRDLTDKLLASGGASFHGKVSLIVALADAGWIDSAAMLCNGLPELLGNNGIHRQTGRRDWLPQLLDGIAAKPDRYRIELGIAAIRLNRPVETLEESGPARLMPLAERFAETADMSALSQVQCLALLCLEPSVAYRIKHELERVSGGFKPADFRPGSKLLDDLGPRDAWRLEAAHLGNLFHDGRMDEVAIRLETVMADPGHYANGAEFVGLCIEVLHEHALWLLAEGRADRVVAAIPLSRQLYATVMESGGGWNYRDAATIFVELCHAAGKRYADFEQWLGTQAEEFRKDYQNRRYGPKEFEIHGLWAFNHLNPSGSMRGDWNGPACEELRVAGIITLVGDPALMRAQSKGRAPGEIIANRLLPGSAAALQDKLDIIARWRARHGSQPLLDEAEEWLRGQRQPDR